MSFDKSVGALGIVVGGSLSRGVDVRLDPEASPEDVKIGTYVIIEGASNRIFARVTDVTLESTDPRLRTSPMGTSDTQMARAMLGTVAFTTITVDPTLVIGGDVDVLLEGPKTAKTLPGYFSRVYAASSDDVEAVFGKEDERHVWIGSPLDMEETRVHLDVAELVKRSNGVFGKSGTGKSFLTRILLAGILQRHVAVNLVFDMHSEYGWGHRNENNREVKGLKQLFQSRVAVFALDEESASRRGVSADFNVRIGYDEIEPQDIETLASFLNLTEHATQATWKLARHFKHQWLKSFLALRSSEALAEIAAVLGEHEQTIGSLHRRLERLERLDFLVEQPSKDSVRSILEKLDQGIHVVLEFGRYGRDLAAYILVANLLSRRIHSRYVQRTEEALGNKDKEPPRPLVITIEEAHRFLNPQVAGNTIFGTIAREMRKYNVTLLVVDQRPSGIDDEVLSQLGTKLVCQLDNERDVDAALIGGRKLKGVLERLDSKQEALIFGHAVPMPVSIRTRDYGTPESYAALGLDEQTDYRRQEEMERDAKDLFG
jgi:DNA helicase HerA-like ATPase